METPVDLEQLEHFELKWLLSLDERDRLTWIEQIRLACKRAGFKFDDLDTNALTKDPRPGRQGLPYYFGASKKPQYIDHQLMVAKALGFDKCQATGPGEKPGDKALVCDEWVPVSVGAQWWPGRKKTVRNVKSRKCKKHQE